MLNQHPSNEVKQQQLVNMANLPWFLRAIDGVFDAVKRDFLNGAVSQVICKANNDSSMKIFFFTK